MTVTLNLPPDVERAFLAEAQTRGLTLDEFISAMLLSQSPARQAPSTKAIHSSIAASRFFPLEQEDGVPVLRTGQPINPSVIDDTLDLIRRERDLSMLGTFQVKSFLDTSSLFPVFLADHPHHTASLRLYKRCTPDAAFCASHSLAEIYSTLTRIPPPHRVAPDQAVEFLESMRGRFSFTWNTRHFQLLGTEMVRRLRTPDSTEVI